jgi:CelD/BcsL family acetyltransferase involved in cellulose biosynthesis
VVVILRQGDALYFYNSAVDIASFSKLSPGTVGLSHVIEWAVREGFKEFHFFKGGKGSYKDRWTSESVGVSTVVIRRKNLRTRLVGAGDALKRMRRHVR